MPKPAPITLQFNREKDTKNTVKFEEEERPGQPKIIGSLYVQKFHAGATASFEMVLTAKL